MLSRIIIFALILAVVYLNYTTPKIDDHKAFLLEKMETGFALDKEQLARIWKKTDYSDFLVCSFVKDTESNTFFSYGFLKTVQLANDNWTELTRTKTLQRSTF